MPLNVHFGIPENLDFILYAFLHCPNFLQWTRITGEKAFYVTDYIGLQTAWEIIILNSNCTPTHRYKRVPGTWKPACAQAHTHACGPLGAACPCHCPPWL